MGAGERSVMTTLSLRLSEAFEQLVLDFLADLEMDRGLACNTLDAYRGDLLQFGAFLVHRERDALAVEHDELTAFVCELSEGRAGKAPVAPSTLRRKVSCLRSFYDHLRRTGTIERNPAAELKGPRLQQRGPQSLSREEVGRLLAQPAGTSPAALRDRALLELIYACGLRASEAIALELCDLDLQTGVLRADANGSRARLVRVSPSALAAVRSYLQRGRPTLVRLREVHQVFINQRGGALTRQGLYKIVQRRAREAALPEWISPHTLRHACATHRFASGSELRSLQAMLGHTDLATTRRYTQLPAAA